MDIDEPFDSYEEDEYIEDEEDDIDMYEDMNKPRECQSVKDYIEKLHKLNLAQDSRVCYGFVTSEDIEGTKGFILHPRTGVPCYGELRKYTRIHTDCHQPEDRPSDLHYPFPKSGYPVAVSLCFYHKLYHLSSNWNEFVEYLFSNESPWVTGFKDESFIEFTFNNKSLIRGVVIKTGDLDPTVLVNLCKFIEESDRDKIDAFFEMIDHGMTKDEAIISSMFLSSSPTLWINIPNTYHMPVKGNFKRVVAKNPNILTKGGTFHERGDYSRQKMHMPFGVIDREKEKGVCFVEELNKRGVTHGLPIREFVPIAKKIIQAALEA